MGELVRVPEGEVDVRLGCEVEDCVDLVLTQNAFYISRGGDVAVLEGKVRKMVESSCVVQ
jgi:hypothetical protein